LGTATEEPQRGHFTSWPAIDSLVRRRVPQEQSNSIAMVQLLAVLDDL
jgi:hypothetical protein